MNNQEGQRQEKEPTLIAGVTSLIKLNSQLFFIATKELIKEDFNRFFNKKNHKKDTRK